MIVQTFRPRAPEILYATEHKTEMYLQEEMKLRTAAKYPPLLRMIRFVLRGPSAQKRAMALAAAALRASKFHAPDARIGSAPTFHGGGNIWQVLIRAEHPRAILPHLDLEGVIVDVDPIETI